MFTPQCTWTPHQTRPELFKNTSFLIFDYGPLINHYLNCLKTLFFVNDCESVPFSSEMPCSLVDNATLCFQFWDLAWAPRLTVQRFCRNNKTYWIQLQDLAWATWPTELSSEILHEQPDMPILIWNLVWVPRLTAFSSEIFCCRSRARFLVSASSFISPVLFNIINVTSTQRAFSEVQIYVCTVNSHTQDHQSAHTS